VAIIKSLGFQKASIFGTSGGGIIAFQLGASYPEYVEHLIAHEAPTTALLPDNTARLDFCFEVYEKFKADGPMAAFQHFGSQMVGMQNPNSRSTGAMVNGDFFFEYEFIVLTIYTPNMAKLRDNGVSVAVTAGEESGDAYYVRTTSYQAEILGCRRIMWPGHHVVYRSDPAAFVAALHETLLKLEDSRK